MGNSELVPRLDLDGSECQPRQRGDEGVRRLRLSGVGRTRVCEGGGTRSIAAPIERDRLDRPPQRGEGLPKLYNQPIWFACQ